MKRRTFLGALAAAALARGALARAASRAVVVVGGGIGGVAFCLALKRIAPETEITLVEPNARLLFAPAAFDYLFGRAPLEAVSRGYDRLERLGIRHVRAEVVAVEPKTRRVRTSAGSLDYGRLVIASGIRPAAEEIEGLRAAQEANFDLYQRSRLAPLRARIAAFDGGTVLIGVPPPPHSCPPAPYEFALLLAGHIRARRLKARIVLLDANAQPQPAPLASALDAALQASGDVIEHVPSLRVAGIEPRARRVVSADGERFSYDLACVIAPHRAARFVTDAGLGEGPDPFVQVDALTFRSAREEAIYAFGDAARTPYARAAQAAFEAGRRCALVVARSLGARPPAAAPLGFETPCYPYVSAEEALSLRIQYEATGNAPEARVAAQTEPAPEHAAARRAWQARLLDALFAA
jgi:NADPH-dependent 2,4-dienoyl-CoA reductase/sulfur reductase-like enzyme